MCWESWISWPVDLSFNFVFNAVMGVTYLAVRNELVQPGHCHELSLHLLPMVQCSWLCAAVRPSNMQRVRGDSVEERCWCYIVRRRNTFEKYVHLTYHQNVVVPASCTLDGLTFSHGSWWMAAMCALGELATEIYGWSAFPTLKLKQCSPASNYKHVH